MVLYFGHFYYFLNFYFFLVFSFWKNETVNYSFILLLFQWLARHGKTSRRFQLKRVLLRLPMKGNLPSMTASIRWSSCISLLLYQDSTPALLPWQMELQKLLKWVLLGTSSLLESCFWHMRVLFQHICSCKVNQMLASFMFRWYIRLAIYSCMMDVNMPLLMFAVCAKIYIYLICLCDCL